MHLVAHDAWLEIDDGALRHNARAVARLAGDRRIVAVVKNNAYGLGLIHVGLLFDVVAEIAGLAVVRPADALALRAAGVRKPILCMGCSDVDTGIELTRDNVAIAGSAELLTAVATTLRRPARAQFYIDTGMHRLGMPPEAALATIEALVRARYVRVDGVFTELAESDTHDSEQLARFTTLITQLRERGIDPGMLHASSTHALFFRRDDTLDTVRPGLALYGAYPAGARTGVDADVRSAFRLCARVVRVAQVKPGDGVSYDHNYVAERPTWIATVPVGHADGYPRQAVRGAQVLINSRLYRVIGAVSAGHTILEIGDEPTVRVGDVATLVGPDDPAILPNTLAERAGISVYDVLMHLGAELPRVTVTS